MIATITSTESSMASEEEGCLDMLMQAGLRLDKRSRNGRCLMSLIIIVVVVKVICTSRPVVEDRETEIPKTGSRIAMRITLRGNEVEGYLSAQLAHAGYWTLSIGEQALFLGFRPPRIVSLDSGIDQSNKEKSAQACTDVSREMHIFLAVILCIYVPHSRILA